MEKNYIRFAWALKRLLRNKADYIVLEGFLTTLLNEKITICHLLESESNQEDSEDKYNRVDLLAEDSQGELILIEVQNNTEYAYFQRMLFGTSKLLTQYIKRGEPYSKIRKIYSINIVYFALGHGKDIVYRGRTEFRGLIENDLLDLSPSQKARFKIEAVADTFPEYYILRINDFNKVAKSPLEEWIAYLRTGDIPDHATAPGLPEARKLLQLDHMTKAEQEAYYRHLDNLVILQDNIETGREEGLAEGIAKGIAKGLEEGKAQGIAEGMAEEKKAIALAMKNNGADTALIARCTGLTTDEIKNLG